MSTIRTTIRTYQFDTSTADGRAGWDAFRAERVADKCPHEMESLGNMSGGGFKHAGFYYLPHLDGVEVELEATHLFDNQWSAKPIPSDTIAGGRRLFDWAIEVAYAGERRLPMRQGHYLVQTPEMRDLRRNTMKCGYCGKQEPAAKGYVFCPHCIDSEYLKEEDLLLTRMRSVEQSGPRGKFQPLTEAERSHLLPKYREAQTHGTTERGKARIAGKRADVLAKFAAATQNATTERDGFLWLLDRGINTADVIFYSHTGRFGFGWRQPLGEARLAGLLEALGAEFSFPYDIACADGRKLSGN